MERIVSWGLGIRRSLVTLWIEVAAWVTGHSQQIREAFAVASNPLLVLFEGQLACLELLGEDVGDEGPADLLLLIGVRSSLLAPSSWHSIVATQPAWTLVLNLTHL